MSRRNRGNKGQSEPTDTQVQDAPETTPDPEVQAQAPEAPSAPSEDPFANIPTHQAVQSPAPPSSSSVDKIIYADAAEEAVPTISREEIVQETLRTGGGGSGHFSSIQAMRNKALEQRKANLNNIGAGGHKFEHKFQPRTAEEDAAAAAKRYRVEGSPPPVRASGRTIRLYEGKEIDENNYDVPHLLRSGVRLQQIVG